MDVRWLVAVAGQPAVFVLHLDDLNRASPLFGRGPGSVGSTAWVGKVEEKRPAPTASTTSCGDTMRGKADPGITRTKKAMSTSMTVAWFIHSPFKALWSAHENILLCHACHVKGLAAYFGFEPVPAVIACPTFLRKPE